MLSHGIHHLFSKIFIWSLFQNLFVSNANYVNILDERWCLVSWRWVKEMIREFFERKYMLIVAENEFGSVTCMDVNMSISNTMHAVCMYDENGCRHYQSSNHHRSNKRNKETVEIEMWREYNRDDKNVYTDTIRRLTHNLFIWIQQQRRRIVI